MPPVGMKDTAANGAAKAEIARVPPAVSAKLDGVQPELEGRLYLCSGDCSRQRQYAPLVATFDDCTAQSG